MEKEQINTFIMTHKKYFPEEKITYIMSKLEQTPEEKFPLISSLELKEPSTMLLISIFVGSWGIDRFLLGETGMGILKLLTGGLCGILTIIDWFTVSKKVKERNYNALMTIL